MIKSSNKNKICRFGIILERETLILTAFWQLDFFWNFVGRKISQKKIKLPKRSQD